jgi:hypothetical protein
MISTMRPRVADAVAVEEDVVGGANHVGARDRTAVVTDADGQRMIVLGGPLLGEFDQLMDPGALMMSRT